MALLIRQSPLFRLILALLLSGLLPVRAQPSREYDLKAVFLYNFASFVSWPEHAFPDPHAPLVIGVLGHDPFGRALENVVAGERTRGRSFAVTRVRNLDDARACHILFISRSEIAHLPRIFRHLRDFPVLTVGDSPEFARAGGMIGFSQEGSFVRLHVNQAAVRASELTISSKLLQLARVIPDVETLQ